MRSRALVAREPLVGVAAFVEPGRDLVGAEARAEVRALHPVVDAVGLARVAEDLVPPVERGADRAAGVAGGRLDPEVLERSLAQQPPVGDAVQRDPAGQARVARAGGRRRARAPC